MKTMANQDQITSFDAPLMERAARLLEPIILTVGAVVAGFGLFAIFLGIQGISPVTFALTVWQGGFGSAFSLANALERAAPLILAALCVALPARVGLVVIGGEGAIVMGGLAAAMASQWFLGWPAPLLLMALAAGLAGGFGLVSSVLSATRVP
ncbi:hypothetical protein [Falsihalocynthiibacter arcticus]|uniref:hypothetical protein n=1 Tax=Falsihalocynthiibacter arcticus TaxID=1579316 RepID=UPI001F3D8050|nr:hypothetical protein [Falsihalocynthiibacter arcticus]